MRLRGRSIAFYNSLTVRANKVLGLDTNTNNIAFSLFDHGKLVSYGKINFVGSSIYERVLDAGIKSDIIEDLFDFDYVAIEASVFVRNKQVAIKMAYVSGAIMKELQMGGAKVETVPPIEWQSAIGNKNYTKAQKEAVAKEFPGKSKTWISNEIRNRRKQFTIDYVNDKYGLDLNDNDITDAIAIGEYISGRVSNVQE